MLARQVLDIPLGGLETKVDARLVGPGKSLLLENAEFNDVGALKKRNGYTAMSANVLSGGTFSGARGLYSFGDELLMLTASQLLAWSPTSSKWVSKTPSGTPAWQCKTSEERLPCKSGTSFQTDVAIANGIAVFAYRSTLVATSTIYVTVVDVSSGTELLSAVDSGLGVTSQMRVVASGNYVYIVSADHVGNIHMTYVDTATVPSSLPAVSAIVTASGGNFSFDVGSLGSGNVVIGYTDTSNDLSALIFSTGGPGSPVTVIGSITVSSQVGVVVTAANEIFFALKTSTPNLVCRATSADLSTPLFATTTIDAALASCDHPVGVEVSSNVVAWYWNALAAGTASSNYRRIRSARINNAGSVTSSAADVVRNHHLLTRPWLHNNEVFFGAYYAGAVLGASETIQPTYFIWNMSSPVTAIAGRVAGKLMAFRGVDEASLTGTPLLRPSGVATVSSGVYWFGGAGSFGGVMSAARLAADFNYTPVAARSGRNLYLSGGMPLDYDGSGVFEQGFNAYPEIVGTGQSASGGSLSDGTYQVAAVFSHVDGNGNVHRSAPSLTEEVVLTGGGSSQRILVYVASLFSTRRDVRVEVYVSTEGNTTLYLSATAANATGSVETTISATAVSATSRIIYTNGGVLENSAPPALVSITAKSNRIYGVTHDGTIYYTKEIIEGEGAAYVQDTSIARLPTLETFALAAVDDNLLAVGQDRIYLLQGEGIDDTGLSSTLGQPRTIATDAGMIAGSPLVETSAGLFFKSTKGICLLNRALQVDHTIGAPVEDYDSLALVSAVALPNKKQVRFGHSDGHTLVYDYHGGQWGVFTNHSQLAACVWNDTYCMLKSTTAVWQQSAAFIDGDGASILRRFDTPWIRVGSLQGFQRALWLALLSEWRSEHTLSMSLYINHDPTAVATVTKQLLDADYDSGDPAQLRHHIGRQRCKALKVRIEDTVGTGEASVWNGLALELAGKQGVFRVPASKTI